MHGGDGQTPQHIGPYFDERLNWKEHLKTLTARASKKLNLLKTLAHKE
jgi:hypothetical protein